MSTRIAIAPRAEDIIREPYPVQDRHRSSVLRPCHLCYSDEEETHRPDGGDLAIGIPFVQNGTVVCLLVLLADEVFATTAEY